MRASPGRPDCWAATNRNALSSSVDLQVLRYQFPEIRDDSYSYDDNWLIISGAVTTHEGSWSFTDPCLLTGEARQLSTRLRSVAAGTVTVTEPDAEGLLSPDTWFLEPVPAVSLAGHDDEGAVIRVHLSLEAAPPWLQEDDGANIYQYFVQVRTDEAALCRAADQWDLALDAFPAR